jgi:hypothetical protein
MQAGRALSVTSGIRTDRPCAVAAVLPEQEQDQHWMSALEKLSGEDGPRDKAACEQLRAVRRGWIGSLEAPPPCQEASERWLVAAAHLELAALAVVRRQVASVKQAVQWEVTEGLSLDQHVVAEVGRQSTPQPVSQALSCGCSASCVGPFIHRRLRGSTWRGAGPTRPPSRTRWAGKW